jgi:hypothetical protein
MARENHHEEPSSKKAPAYIDRLIEYLVNYAKIEGRQIVLDQMSGSLHWTGGPLIICATPNWITDNSLSISVVTAENCLETVDQYDLHIEWTGDLQKDLLLYLSEVEKAIQRAEAYYLFCKKDQ